MTAHRCALLFCAFFLVVPLHAAGPATAPDEKGCVAVLDLEVLADMPADTRKALAGVLDTLLADSVAQQKGFVTVDRQALDKVLAERAMEASGLTKINSADVVEPLRPFWSAGVLICSTLLSASTEKTNSSAGPAKLILQLEAVSAQTGQLRASLLLPLAKSDDAAIQAALADKLAPFWRQTQQDIAADAGRPLVEVTGQLPGKLTRLQWMVDDLADAVRATVGIDRHLRLLVPRQPSNTKEERLLRVMGLSADRGNEACGLHAAPDARLSFELIDSAKAGVELDKSPITVKLSLANGPGQPITAAFDSTVGQWEACRAETLKWVSAELPKLGKGPAGSQPDLDRTLAAKMAQEELNAVSQWVELNHGFGLTTSHRIRRMILDHALRAAHLDPTNELAAVLVACYVEATYEGDGFTVRSVRCYDRMILECQRYISHFGRKVPVHHREVLFTLYTAAAEARATGMAFHYARIRLRAEAEHGYLSASDPSYGGSNIISAFGIHLVFELIPFCPDESLDEEYSYWKDFWRNQMAEAVAKQSELGKEIVPWDLVDAAFAARRKDPQATRTALGRLAKVCPKDRTRIWGGGEWKYQTVGILLHAAGDPDWNTWQPRFGDGILLPPKKLGAFLTRLKPIFPNPLPADKSPPIPAQLLDLFENGRRVTPTLHIDRLSPAVILLADGGAWVSNLDSLAGGGLIGGVPSPATLRRAVIPDVREGSIHLDMVPVPWPKRVDGGNLPAGPNPAIYTVLVQRSAEGTVVWIGTTAGLARYDRATGGDWTTRWYTTRDGLLCDDVRKVASARLNGKDVLLLIGKTTLTSGLSVSALNPVTNQVTLLYDGAKEKARLANVPAAKLRDGRVVLVEFLGHGAYGDVDLKEIDRFVAGGNEVMTACVEPRGSKRSFIWEAGSIDRNTRQGFLREVAPEAVGTGRSAFRSQWISAFPDNAWADSFWFGDFCASGDCVAFSMSPQFISNAMVGIGDTIWITTGWKDTRILWFQPGSSDGENPTPDRWIGPFASPDGSEIIGLRADDNERLLLTTGKGSYVVSCAEAVRAAEKAGLVNDAETIARQVREGLARLGWQGQVPAMVLAGQFQQALDLLDSAEKKLGDKPADPEEPVRLKLWRAAALARMPTGQGLAIDTYKAVAQDEALPLPARAFARANQAYLLYKSGRFAETIEAIEQLLKDFPQAKDRWTLSHLSWFLDDSRKRLAASSQPDAGIAPPGSVVGPVQRK